MAVDSANNVRNDVHSVRGIALDSVALVADGGGPPMSVEDSQNAPPVSDHALWRFMQRGDGAASQFDVQVAWRRGYPVKVPSKSYCEARYTTVRGAQLVLLQQGTHIATVVSAPQESVTFVGSPPELHCSCGASRCARRLRTCPECGCHSWSFAEVTE